MAGELKRNVVLTPFDKVIMGRNKPEQNIIRLAKILTK